MNRLVPAVCLAASLLLAGCSDARRPVARSAFEGTAPEGFTVVAVPENIFVATRPDGTSEATATVRYRLSRSTIETRDGFTLPRAAEIAARLTALRGWALSALPANDPTRTAILTGVAEARAPFPVKRVVTPAGTELDATATVELRRADAGWQTTSFHADAAVPGAPDTDPAIPFEDAPAVATRLDQLEATARRLEETRREYLAARQRNAERSRLALGAALRTGQTFQGLLPGGIPLRLVISRGLEAGPPVVVVLTVEDPGASTARFSGGLVLQPSGEMIFRSSQVITLSASLGTSVPAATDSGARPVLSLFITAAGVAGRLETAGRPAMALSLRRDVPADLIPDVEPPSGPISSEVPPIPPSDN